MGCGASRGQVPASLVKESDEKAQPAEPASTSTAPKANPTTPDECLATQPETGPLPNSKAGAQITADATDKVDQTAALSRSNTDECRAKDPRQAPANPEPSPPAPPPDPSGNAEEPQPASADAGPAQQAAAPVAAGGADGSPAGDVTQKAEQPVEQTAVTNEQEEDEEPPFKPFIKLLQDGPKGDELYRRARIKSRNDEPVKPPKLANPAEEAELKRVWTEEWFCFPRWDLVLFTRAAVGRQRWRQMSSDRRRAACERFVLCGPWAASQEPDEASLAVMRATGSSSLFVMLEHPARRELFLGAFATGHGLARIHELKSDRPYDPGTWDCHGETQLGEKITTAEICYKIVIPATRAFGASYVDLYLTPALWGSEAEAAKHAVQCGAEDDGKGAASPLAGCRFLSHAWGMPFMQLVTVAIVEGTPPRHRPGPYWIDIFCKNQHVPIKESDLTDNILASRGVTLAVWPWPAPLLTTRVWCLFEILNAVKTKVKLELKLCEGAHRQFRKVLGGKYNGFNYSRVKEDVASHGLSHVLPGASELIQAIDVRLATATVPADKDMILRLIEGDMGAVAMNELVRQMLEGGLADAAADVVEAVVGESRMGYVSYQGGWD